MSTSTDLLNDAQRDLTDVGALGIKLIDGPAELDKHTKVSGAPTVHPAGSSPLV